MINHGFPPKSNSAFSNAEHPRFGMVTTIVATRNIEIGEELFLDYSYGSTDAYKAYFPWYFEQKEIYIEHLKKERNII
jgi:hypothetical protein